MGFHWEIHWGSQRGCHSGHCWENLMDFHLVIHWGNLMGCCWDLKRDCHLEQLMGCHLVIHLEKSWENHLESHLGCCWDLS